MSDTARWIFMRMRTTDCCSIRKGSGFAMTQETLRLNECQTLIDCAQDFLAKHSLLPGSEKDLQMSEELSSLRLPDWLQTSDLRILSLKTYPDCYRMTKGGRFTPSSVRYLSWGIIWNGKCLTARISGFLCQQEGDEAEHRVVDGQGHHIAVRQHHAVQRLVQRVHHRAHHEHAPHAVAD